MLYKSGKLHGWDVWNSKYMRSVRKKSSHCSYNENGDISVAWQPRRVDWNVLAGTMTTSLYLVSGDSRCHWVSHVYCVAVLFKMTEWVEQWVCIIFCVKLEHSTAETIGMIQKAFRDNAVTAVQVKVWQKCFRDGQEFVESGPCSGRPAASRIPENVKFSPPIT